MKIQNGFFCHRVNRVLGEATLLALIVLLPIAAAQAQHEADNWIFGYQAWLKFPGGGGSPGSQSGAVISTLEGSSSISDQSGNLLFYTDGTTVWNRNHIPMKFGSNQAILHGGGSSTQSALIVPLPSSECQRYLIFTVDEMGVSTTTPKNQKLYCAVVDMTSGLGNVTSNTWLKDWVSEKLAAVKDSSGTGFWLVAHGFHLPEPTNPNPPENKEFYAYHVTSATTGFNLLNNQVTSSVGTAHQTGSYQPSSGQMKISPDGQWIACAVNTAFVEVLNFNAAASGSQAGSVTQPTLAKKFLSLQFQGTPNSFYGLEFSPNSQLLYVSTLASYGLLFQINFQASTPTITQIPVVKNQPSTNRDLGQLQLGPDNRIYLARETQSYISVINSPNAPGVGSSGCDFVDNGPTLSVGTSSQLGLPTMIGGSFSCAVAASPTATPTPTPTATETATCATITEPRVTCDQGTFTYTFTVTNNTNQQIEWLLFSTPSGATYNISPPYIHLTSPVPPGGQTTASVSITNASPGDHVCLNVALADRDLISCCTVQTCFDLRCPCLQLLNQSITCSRSGVNTFAIGIRNLTGAQIQQIFVVPVPPSPPNVNVALSPVTLPLAVNGTTVLTGTITGAGAQPGTQVCLRIVPFGAEAQCCSSDNVCFNVRDCVHSGIAPTPQQKENVEKKP